VIKPIILAYERMKAVAAMPNGKIFIRGAGAGGHLLFADLVDLGIRTFAFIDAADIQPPIANGCQVLKPEEFYTLYPSTQNEIFVACALERNIYKIIRVEMEEHGYSERMHFADFGASPDMYRPNSPPMETVKPIGKNRSERIDKEIKYLYEYHRVNFPDYTFSIGNEKNNLIKIPSVGLFITSKCSLKCKLCGISIPYLNNRKDFEPDIMISDATKLLSVASIGMIYLVGGEPFCHTQFEKIIDLLLNIDLSHCDCIKIVTNSTIKPNEAIMKKIARLKNVYIFSSDYGKYSKKKDDIINSCKANGIPHISNNLYKWVSFGDMKYSRNYSIDTLKHLFKICNSTICFTLLEGKLYVCGQLAIYYYYNLIPDNPSDYIDISNTTQEELQEKLHKFIYETEYLNGCQYCDGIYYGCKEYPKAEQVNSKIGE
jgi:hypothetical protein